MAHATAHAASHNDTNPHGEPHRAHVIVPPFQLRAVLAALLFFTALTVGIAQFEVWVMDFFNIVLPHWVNIVGAMLIATIKAILVMAIFMQLRYDNPMNTVVMLFTFFAVGLFLLFTSLDIFTRGAVYTDKATIVVQGGTYEGGKPKVLVERERAITEWGPEEFARREAIAHAKHKHHGHEAPRISTASQSRPITGLTGALDTTPPAAHTPGTGTPHTPAPGAH